MIMKSFRYACPIYCRNNGYFKTIFYIILGVYISCSMGNCKGTYDVTDFNFCLKSLFRIGKTPSSNKLKCVNNDECLELVRTFKIVSLH